MMYTKYDASGNTFVIFNTTQRQDYHDLAVKLCHKDEFDADGLIVILPHPTLDFQWLFYNNDGSEASMCGNGTRAVAHYALKNKLANEKMTFLTGAGEISCEVSGDIVESEMTKPIQIKEPFTEKGLSCCIVDTGVPHVVIYVDDVKEFDLEICAYFRKKYNANVNYMMEKNASLYVRTFERGVEGETLACGTGMIACFLRASNLGIIASKIKVYPTSLEELIIRREDETLYFKGKVSEITKKEI